MLSKLKYTFENESKTELFQIINKATLTVQCNLVTHGHGSDCIHRLKCSFICFHTMILSGLRLHVLPVNATVLAAYFGFIALLKNMTVRLTGYSILTIHHFLCVFDWLLVDWRPFQGLRRVSPSDCKKQAPVPVTQPHTDRQEYRLVFSLL